MQRIMVMGCSGAGKSTFARALADKLALPLISLDALFWQPGWREPDKQEFDAMVRRETGREAWVMDGGYIRYGARERLARTDMICWFDLPTRTCMAGALRRIVSNHGTVRPEMARGCPERFDWTFIQYIWTFRDKQRPGLMNYFAALRDDQKLVTFRSRRAANAFLAGVGSV